MVMKIEITTQAWEWYGDEDHIGDPAHGRHKAKGGESFIIEADENILWDMEKLEAQFNEKYNARTNFWRYEFRDANIYWEPKGIKYSPSTGFKD